MSLEIADGSTGESLRISTAKLGTTHVLALDGKMLSLETFIEAATYVLTNTDLLPGDPRLPFIEKVKSLQQVPGYAPGEVRLSPISPQ